MSAADPLTVCALVPYPLGTTPSQRFRLEQWSIPLLARGIALHFRPFADQRLMALLHQRGRMAEKLAVGAWSFIRAAAFLSGLRRFDAVVIHRTASLFGPAVLERVVAALRRPVIFDFDDAIYLLHTTPANRGIGWLKFPGKTTTLCRIAERVIVANRGLADYARRYNQNVCVIPSSVDTERYQPAPAPAAPSTPLRLGWTGSSTSLAYLEMFTPVLRLLRERLAFELIVHSDRQPSLQEIPFVWRPWSPETEVEELARFDIGVMPMPDDAWARGKSAMKALLYMAMGIPAVCSDVGTNRDVIRHGENGLLVTSPQSWVETIESLAGDPGLRRRIGREGRRTVEERYSKQVCAARFAEVVREVVT